jgi:phage/plasmid-like protein (TIGR03299 family)
MAHEFETGFFVREGAWHKLGVVLQDYPGREEAMRLAGHNFTVEERKIAVDGTEIVGWKALKRSDNGKVISVVNDTYEPIQNSVLWDILDAIVAQPNVKYETAGVLKEGRLLWALARLDEPWKVPGDDSATLPFVNVGAAHDATRALEAMAMDVRVVCANTYQMAKDQARKRGYYYSFRHTAKVQERLSEASECLQTVRKQFEDYKTLTTELAAHPVTQEGVTNFIMKFIPEPSVGETTQRAQNFIEEARAKFAELLGGVTVPEAHRRTAYGLWCAGVEFLDHTRAYRSNETYFNRCTQPSALKEQLAKLALSI